MARACDASAARIPEMAAVMRERGADDATVDRVTGHSADERQMIARELRQQAVALRQSDCWWVTPDMTAVALDASADLPEWTPAQAMPDRQGLLVWDGGLPPLPWPGAPDGVWERNALGRRVPPLVTPHGVTWRTMPPGRLEVDVLTRADLLPAGSLHGSWQATPLMSVVTVVMTDMTRPAAPPTDLLWAAGLVHTLGATWLLSQQPTVAQQHPVTVDRADARSLGRAGLPVGDVRLVDLRVQQAPREAEDEPGASGRHLTGRHLVRGHWRQQPCGPRNSQRKPLWIAPFVQGPAGAPLIERDRVMVWRR